MPLLSSAIEHAVRLGRSGPATRLDLSLGLKVNHADRLARLIASGRTITPEQYAAEFGPDAAMVHAALGALTAGGLSATWRPGAGLIAAGGTSPAARGLFGIASPEHRLAGGQHFFVLR